MGFLLASIVCFLLDQKNGVMSDWNNKLKEKKNSHIREIEARDVQLDLRLDPPT